MSELKICRTLKTQKGIFQIEKMNDSTLLLGELDKVELINCREMKVLDSI